MFVLLNCYKFRDYLLDKAREREKRELEAQQNISVKFKVYVGDETALGLGVILGQCHVPLKQFLDEFRNRVSIYSDDVLLNVSIKKKLLSKDYVIQTKFPGFDFLVYQLIADQIESLPSNILRISKSEVFHIIKLKSASSGKSEFFTTKIFFSYLETIVKGGSKSNKIKICLI